MAKNDGLASNFVVELLAAALEKRTVFEIVRQYLKFSYLQIESEKKLWQWVTKRYDRTGKIPTIGQIQQQFQDDENVLEKLEEIADVEIDEQGGHEMIVDTFEKFIKKMKFLEANDKIADLYNQGKKEQSWDMFVKYAEDFSKFSIQSAKFETVFGDFAERQAKRKSDEWQFRYKIPTGIDEIDYRLGGDNGGPETGECVLWLGDSGAGKSQVLVSVGISAARQGFRVAHFQLEGTKEQCLNRYDAAWTGTLYQDVKLGNITSKKMEVTKRIIKKLRKSDIIVSSEETFNAKTLPDIRREVKEMEKTYGKIDVIIIDYLELLEVGDGHNYTPHEERFRQAKLAKGMKMLAMEFNAVVHTATQSSSIGEEQKNDPEFVITRAQLSEDKGKIRPFDIFITINQTMDESKEEIMRLHTDKLRDYKNGDPIHICNNFAYARFYDRKRTLNTDWDEYETSNKED
jgi:replicative DNA helicase|nr:MAG TPA: DnaB-like replicative helicase [Caudoviricetes sp.]